MKYFHRTALGPDAVLEEAEQFFGAVLEPVEQGARSRTFRGTIGTITLDVRAEGGHYTLITATTDQVAESEADKSVKRFLGTVHTRAEPSHALRGAY